MRVRPCRVLREGPAPGPRQVAVDRATLAACAPQETAWLRLHRYLPTASLGRDEAVCHAVREDFCRQMGIPVVRRPTGGGALYLDPGQCCLSLTLPRAWLEGDDRLDRLMERCNGAVARGLRRLGVAAGICAPNDLEAGGRKLGAGFLRLDADAVLYQAVLLVEPVDTETLLTVLRAPREKLSPQGVQSARERFTTLSEQLDAMAGMPSLEDALEAALLAEFGLLGLPGELPEAGLETLAPDPVPAGLTEDWAVLRDRSWQAFEATPGGVLHLRLDPDATGRCIAGAALAGAAHVSPPTLLADLADALTVASPGAAEARWDRHLEDPDVQLLGFGADDLRRLLRRALNRVADQGLGLSTGQANSLMVHPAGGVDSARQILGRATVMLVPYCAKPAWCKWRHRDGCPECGECEVGDAYRMARERGMRVVTVTRYEHLRAVLEQMREAGEPGYVGMCCSNFYLKRVHAFREAGMPAVLMDISGSNCYELRQEDQAYAGQFAAEAHLDGEVVEKVMRWVPPRP
jgi:lipoate---protein ligase